MGKPSNRTASSDTNRAREPGFHSSDLGTGGGVVEIKANGKDPPRRKALLHQGHAESPQQLGVDWRITFMLSGSILTAMKFDTGEVAWKDRSVCKGSLVYSDGLLYLFSENELSDWRKLLDWLQRDGTAFAFSRNPTHLAHPVVAGGSSLPARSGHDLRLRCEGKEIGADCRWQEACKSCASVVTSGKFRPQIHADNTDIRHQRALLPVLIPLIRVIRVNRG